MDVHVALTTECITIINNNNVLYRTHMGYHIYRSKKAITEKITKASSSNSSSSLATPQSDSRTPSINSLIIYDAVGAVGWPVCQGGISTFISIIIMIVVSSYVVRMFAKTAILVVVVGLLHGLLIVPVILCTVMRINVPKKCNRTESSDQVSTRTKIQPVRTDFIVKETVNS
jgi:hypothetical protein